MYSYNLFLSCDWGTSSFRLKLIETQTASTLYEYTSPDGIKEIHDKSLLKLAIGDDKVRFYQEFILEKIKILASRAESNFKYIPLVLSGMASSSIGLMELPYANLPLSLKAPSIPYHWIKSSKEFPYDTLLISGIRSSGDVMRGEETQTLGLSQLEDIRNSLLIIPGTHSKHIWMGEENIEDFQTFMTGEFFSMLRKHSILKNSIASKVPTVDLRAFRRGVEEGFSLNTLNALFHVRTHSLFKHMTRKANYYFLSGVLIGSELKELKQGFDRKVFLCGEGNLQILYKEALNMLNLNYKARVLTQKEVESLVIRGQISLMGQLV